MWEQLSQQDGLGIPRGEVYLFCKGFPSLGITTKTMVAQDILRGQHGDVANPGEGHLCPLTLQAHIILEKWWGLKKPLFI